MAERRKLSADSPFFTSRDSRLTSPDYSCHSLRLFCACRGAVRDDLVLDAVVRSLRNDVLAYQIVLCVVRTPVDNLLGIGIADARQRLQLIFGGRIDIELRAGRFLTCDSGLHAAGNVFAFAGGCLRGALS